MYFGINENHYYFLFRDSHIVIPNIIRFLFYLSKQKEKKSITIPKIINITDTLLANSITMNGCTEALKELTYEFYFQQDIDEDSLNSDASAPTRNLELDLLRKELSTQKEVAFSMLLKFVNTTEIQKVIGLILLKDEDNIVDMETELVLSFLQMNSENKISLCNMTDYETLNQLFRLIGKNTLTEGKLFEKISKQFYVLAQKKQITFNELALQSIIVEHILLHCNEMELQKFIILQNLTGSGEDARLARLLKQIICKCFEGSLCGTKQTDRFHSEDGIIDYAKILEKFIQLIQTFSKTFRKEGDSFKTDAKFIENSLEQSLEFFTLISNNAGAKFVESIETQLLSVLQMYIEFLIGISCDKTILFHQLNKIGCEKSPVPLDRSDKSIRNLILKSIISDCVSIFHILCIQSQLIFFQLISLK